MKWLLDQETALEMQGAWEAGLAPTAEQSNAWIERRGSTTALDAPRNLRLAGDVAEIAVTGVLTERPDFFAFLFGGGNTTFEEIRGALAVAQADPVIKRVVMNVNSPGGEVDGLFETLAAIEGFTKPISVRSARAASAAFAIASSAGKIEAATVASEFGSIGVAVSFRQDPDAITITSTKAPNKRPDLSTDAGKAVVREKLDALHDLFVDSIARSRGTTVARVNADFGQGATLLAGEAKKRGMIDKIAKPALRALGAPVGSDLSEVERARGGELLITATDRDGNPLPDVWHRAEDDARDLQVATATLVETPPSEPGTKHATAETGGAQTEKKHMDLKTLRAQHPDLVTALLEEGESTGQTKERDRVTAHLTMGEQSGDMKTATTAITDGTEMTQTMTARYMAAGMKRASQGAVQEDSDEAGEALEGAAVTASNETPAQDMGDIVVARLAQQQTGVVA